MPVKAPAVASRIIVFPSLWTLGLKLLMPG
jgi:hypothetical protein